MLGVPKLRGESWAVASFPHCKPRLRCNRRGVFPMAIECRNARAAELRRGQDDLNLAELLGGIAWRLLVFGGELGRGLRRCTRFLHSARLRLSQCLRGICATRLRLPTPEPAMQRTAHGGGWASLGRKVG